jgi:cytochrome c-type biogenesis protein CcmH/NrfG
MSDRTAKAKELSPAPSKNHLSLLEKINRLPLNVALALFLATSSIFMLQMDKYQKTEQILGWQSKIQEEQKTIFEWEAILKEKPDYRDGWIQLAISYLETGNKQQAIRALSRAKEIDPTFEPTLSLEKYLED